jgi:hypothetical protein
MQRYYPLVTYVVVLFLIEISTVWLLRLVLVTCGAMAKEPFGGLLSVALFLPEDALSARFHRRRRGDPRGIAVGILAISMIAIVFGGWQFFSGSRAGQLITTSAAEVESGQPCAGAWVAISGKLLRDARMSLAERSTRTYYIPMVSDAWQPGQPVAVFLAVPDYRFPKLAPSQAQAGMTTLLGLPGPVRAGFAKAGLSPSEHYVVVEAGATPALKRGFGLTALIVGGILLPIAVGLWLLPRGRRTGTPTGGNSPGAAARGPSDLATWGMQ